MTEQIENRKSQITGSLDFELLEILVCPLTRSPLRQEGGELVGEVGGLRYPIREGIPILLIEEAALPDGVESLDAFKQRYADKIPQ
ncbi:MAG: hypothetical protein CMJ21_06070 [Phycisphaerae bacterium]|nr:hypothetical protein [Phycisphaerae bacterium]